MTGEQVDFSRWLQDLATRSTADQMRAVQRYTDLIQRMGRGELNEQQLRDEYMRFAGEETVRYASDLAQLGLDYYTALLDLGRAYNDRFFDQVLSGSAPASRPVNGQTAPTEPRQVRLDLHGVTGQEAAASFVIENKRATAADISFLVSDFVDTAGGGHFPSPLQLQPPWFTLGPAEEAEVKLRLPLPPDRFVPGHLYHTKVVVRGYDDLELIVTVRVDPAAEPATRVSTLDSVPQTTPQPKKRSRAKKTASNSTQSRP